MWPYAISDFPTLWQETSLFRILQFVLFCQVPAVRFVYTETWQLLGLIFIVNLILTHLWAISYVRNFHIVMKNVVLEANLTFLDTLEFPHLMVVGSWLRQAEPVIQNCRLAQCFLTPNRKLNWSRITKIFLHY